MTENDIQNERIKLSANWCNTVATAVLAAGTFVPAAQFIYGVLPQTIDALSVYGAGGICVGVGLLLHLLGQRLLGGLK